MAVEEPVEAQLAAANLLTVIDSEYGPLVRASRPARVQIRMPRLVPPSGVSLPLHNGNSCRYCSIGGATYHGGFSFLPQTDLDLRVEIALKNLQSRRVTGPMTARSNDAFTAAASGRYRREVGHVAQDEGYW